MRKRPILMLMLIVEDEERCSESRREFEDRVEESVIPAYYDAAAFDYFHCFH